MNGNIKNNLNTQNKSNFKTEISQQKQNQGNLKQQHNTTNNHQTSNQKQQTQQQLTKQAINRQLIHYVIKKNKLNVINQTISNICNKQQQENKLNYIQRSNNDQGGPIKKLSGGVINDVYQICKNYVIKIQNVIQGILAHQPQMLELATKAGTKSPKFIDYGSYKNKNYLLMTKIQGQRLWRFWPLLTEKQKQSAIRQICDQLKKLHSIKFNQYSPQRPKNFSSMFQSVQYFNENLKKMINKDKFKQLDPKTQNNLQKLYQFVDNNMLVFKLQQNEQNQAVFIHNDLHFGNILYDINKHQITGFVDFDFSRQLTKDYQLWHLIDVFHKPIKYVQQGQEHLWQNFEIKNQIKYFQKHYPELFQDNYNKLCTKIKIYLFDQMVTMLDYGAIDLFNQNYQSYYKTNWLHDFLYL